MPNSVHLAIGPIFMIAVAAFGRYVSQHPQLLSGGVSKFLSLSLGLKPELSPDSARYFGNLCFIGGMIGGTTYLAIFAASYLFATR